MGTMSASDAAPLPRAGEVFFDVRGNARTMRVSWYGDTGVAVFSIWNEGTCTGTFRLPIPELARMIDALSHGPGGAARAPQQMSQGAADPGPPTAAMQLPRTQEHQEGPGYGDVPPGHPDARRGYQDGPQIYPDTAGYGPAGSGQPGHEDIPAGYAESPRGYGGPPEEYPDAGPGYADPGRPYYQPPVPSSREPATTGYADWAELPTGRHGQPAQTSQWYPDEPAGDPYAGDGGPADGYAAGGYDNGGYDNGGYDNGAEPPYPGPAIDELGADPLEADYGGEAEEGYLPSPPTETFSAVAVGGSHSRRAGQPARPGQPGTAAGGYRPAPADPQDTGGHRAYAPPRDPASESLAYHPGRAGRSEREHRPPREGY